MELTDLRGEIDAIDEQLTALLLRRMDCSARVAAYKAAHGLPVFHPEREQQILERVQARGGEYGDACALVYAAILDASRGVQQQRLAVGQALREQLAAARRERPDESTLRLVCQGCEGAYSHEAAQLLFPHSGRPRFVEQFADVFAAVAKGEADIGILPVENSSAGAVSEVYDLLMAHRFTIAGAVELPVRHCLLARPGIQEQELTAVYSHPQALSQCADFIAAHGLTAQPFSNTALAARMVADSREPIAAIASEAAANLYGLKILEKNIQTVSKNVTRFIAISSVLYIPDDANKISLQFALPHRTGSLYHTLARFAMAELNLTKLESRPDRSGRFDYVFYLDFEGHLQRPGTKELLCSLSEDMAAFAFLGNYHEKKTEEQEKGRSST